MYLLKVRVDQHRCSLAVATKNCPVRAEIISYILLNDEDALFLVRITDAEYVTDYIREVETHPNTKFIQVLEKTPIEASFIAVVSDTTGIKAFENSYCFIKTPIIVENGSKIYEIIVPSTSYLPKTYANLNNVGEWKVIEIRSIGERRAGMTEGQRRALKVAYDLGYFSERRKVTINDIAMALGVAKSTAHKHLKIAISKLVEHYIQEKELEKSFELF